jgi:plasmid replication initiation protein
MGESSKKKDGKNMVQDARKLLKGITKKMSPFEAPAPTPAPTSAPIVTKSNAMTRSRHQTTIVEKRVMEMLISKVDSTRQRPAKSISIEDYGNENVNHGLWFSLTAKEYAERTNGHEKTAYRDIEKAAKRLEEIIMRVTEDEKKISRPLIYKSIYVEGKGTIKVLFHPDFLPHLMELKEKFTSYPLESAMKFRSTYAWKMYEVLLSIKNTHHKSITYKIDDLIEVLGMPESYKKYWSSTKSTIEKAMQEITNLTDMVVTYTKNKENKKITSITLRLEIQKR